MVVVAAVAAVAAAMYAVVEVVWSPWAAAFYTSRSKSKIQYAAMADLVR